MKREIKFRAWRKDEKVMFIVNPVWFEEQASFYSDDYAKCAEECNCVLMQYTGLKDKNGKEIYEGDILERKAIETWEETGKARCKVEDIRFLNHLMDGYPFETEVIGNIYQNPELLK